MRMTSKDTTSVAHRYEPTDMLQDKVAARGLREGYFRKAPRFESAYLCCEWAIGENVYTGVSEMIQCS